MNCNTTGIEWGFGLTSTYVTDVTETSVATRKVATPKCEVGCCCTCVRVEGLGFRVGGLEFGVWGLKDLGLEFGVSCWRFRVSCLGMRVLGLRFGVEGLGCSMYGLVFRFWGLGSRVQGLVFGV